MVTSPFVMQRSIPVSELHLRTTSVDSTENQFHQRRHNCGGRPLDGSPHRESRPGAYSRHRGHVVFGQSSTNLPPRNWIAMKESWCLNEDLFREQAMHQLDTPWSELHPADSEHLPFGGEVPGPAVLHLPIAIADGTRTIDAGGSLDVLPGKEAGVKKSNLCCFHYPQQQRYPGND